MMQQLLQEMGPDQITVAVSGLASVLGCAVASNRRRMLGLKRTKQISNAVHVAHNFPAHPRGCSHFMTG